MTSNPLFKNKVKISLKGYRTVHNIYLFLDWLRVKEQISITCFWVRGGWEGGCFTIKKYYCIIFSFQQVLKMELKLAIFFWTVKLHHQQLLIQQQQQQQQQVPYKNKVSIQMNFMRYVSLSLNNVNKKLTYERIYNKIVCQQFWGFCQSLFIILVYYLALASLNVNLFSLKSGFEPSAK